jgi:hypothetical protein
MTQLFKDDARALLTSPILTSDTTITIESSNADKFPVANTGTDAVNTAGKDWFKASIENTAGEIEVVYVRTRALASGVLSNVIRAQEGTTAIAFAAGSVMELRITAADIEAALATPAIVASYLKFMVPVGGVIMYDGLLADLPSNFKVCDGTNGTPDLRDKFVPGVSATRPLGTTGGSADATLPTHNHGFSGTTGIEDALHNHAATVNDPGHLHSYNIVSGDGGDVSISGGLRRNTTDNTSSATTGITVSVGSESAYHRHGYDGTTSSAGTSATNANLPPFYALYYIKRVS